MRVVRFTFFFLILLFLLTPQSLRCRYWRRLQLSGIFFVRLKGDRYPISLVFLFLGHLAAQEPRSQSQWPQDHHNEAVTQSQGKSFQSKLPQCDQQLSQSEDVVQSKERSSLARPEGIRTDAGPGGGSQRKER